MSEKIQPHGARICRFQFSYWNGGRERPAVFIYSCQPIGVQAGSNLKTGNCRYGQGVSGFLSLLSLGEKIIVFLVVRGYFAGMETLPLDATAGKFVLRLRVTNREGKRLSRVDAKLRNLLKPVSALLLMIGFLMAAWSERKQALHDLLAGALVLRR